MKKRIYIAYTGGTIGMKKTPDGYAPDGGFLQEQLDRMTGLQADALPQTVIHEYDPLRDSSDMTPEDWLCIARDIVDHYGDFDGFLVLHGTDTMAYTASALSFLLENLAKPVIVTGSQIPLCEVRSDARENLVASLLIAAALPVPEVCLYFGNLLLRGNRSTKTRADGLDAFESPNCPPLGEAEVHLNINWDLVRRPQRLGSEKLRVRVTGSPTVASLRLFPGLSARMLENVLAPPLEGLVLETFGVGNGPLRDRDFLDVLKRAVDRGVVVVACTQCLHGRVRLGEYASGAKLAQCGVVSGSDMTVEAALTKLYCLLDGRRSPDRVRSLMQTDLRGELTQE